MLLQLAGARPELWPVVAEPLVQGLERGTLVGLGQGCPLGHRWANLFVLILAPSLRTLAMYLQALLQLLAPHPRTPVQDRRRLIEELVDRQCVTATSS